MSDDYKLDFSDRELNIQKLNNEFGLSDKPLSEISSKDLEIQDKEIDESKIPDNILYTNIEKANVLLDKIIDDSNAGNTSGMMMQAAAKLIDSITTATNSIMGVTTQEQELEYKEKVLALKEKEAMIKLILAKQKKGENIDNLTQNIQNNVIVANRESILELIDKYGDNSKSIISNNK